MELFAKDMFFLGDSEKERSYDLCVHGKIVFRIGNSMLSDETDWCVSASAFRFLKTLFENHFTGGEDFLIPCCGHTMIASDDGKTVNIIGCDNGIDFNVIHEQDEIVITTEEKAEYRIPFSEYRNAVLEFAEQVMDFFEKNPPRKFRDSFEKEGYRAFMTQWRTMYDGAKKLGNSEIIPITFEDYYTFTENEISGVSREGISLKSSLFINFKECAYNFGKINGTAKNCVGERKTANLSYTFYTSPKPILIQFIDRNKLFGFVKKEAAAMRFNKLREQLESYGYITYDI